MRSKFEVKPISFEALHELPGAWQLSNYRALLAALDFDDVSNLDDSEVRDMCLMALSEVDSLAVRSLRSRGAPRQHLDHRFRVLAQCDEGC